MTVSEEARPLAAVPEFERQPPQDIAAEQSVLGGMLLSKDAIADVVEVLKPGDFYRPAHQLVYDAVLDLYGRGDPADAITVAADLTRRGEIGRVGGAPYLHTLLSSVPTAANAGYYAHIVAEQAILRRLVEAGTRIVQLGYGSAAGSGLAVDEVVDRAQQAVYDVTERRTSEDYVVLEELLHSTLDDIESIGNRGGVMSGVPTGFADLDGLLNGLHPGQLVVVAARPGVGKALALDTPLPTPAGWTTMGEVEVGDLLVGSDGRPTRVVAATDVLSRRPCFEVAFCDGSTVVADAEHQWLALAGGAPAAVVTTRQMAAGGSYAVPATRPLDLPASGLPTPPYDLGVALGAGAPAPAGQRIPPAYLRASQGQRRDLLAGFLATAGDTVADGTVQVRVGPQLLPDVRELLHGLGHVTGRCDGGLSFCRDGRPGVRRVTAVRPVPSVPVRCVEVDNSAHLYLAGEGMVPTHNSTLGLDFARSCSIKHGMASVIFSLEMSKSEITMRLLSAEAKVPLHHMRAGTMSDDDWQRMVRRMGEIAGAPLFIDDSPNMTMMEIRAKARRLKQRHELRLIVVDYLQLMSSPKRTESRQQEVSELSRGLKLLAKELEVPVVAMSQLNRGPEQRTDKRPQLADLRESGAIEQDSDVVILLYREDMFEKESPRAGEADLIVAKHRNGPTNSVTVAFQGHYSRFMDFTTGP